MCTTTSTNPVISIPSVTKAWLASSEMFGECEIFLKIHKLHMLKVCRGSTMEVMITG